MSPEFEHDDEPMVEELFRQLTDTDEESFPPSGEAQGGGE